MLRKAEVTAPGDSQFVRGEQVEYVTAMAENERLESEGKTPIGFERILLGHHQGILGDGVPSYRLRRSRRPRAC